MSRFDGLNVFYFVAVYHNVWVILLVDVGQLNPFWLLPMEVISCLGSLIDVWTVHLLWSPLSVLDHRVLLGRISIVHQSLLNWQLSCIVWVRLIFRPWPQWCFVLKGPDYGFTSWNRAFDFWASVFSESRFCFVLPPWSSWRCFNHIQVCWSLGNYGIFSFVFPRLCLATKLLVFRRGEVWEARAHNYNVVIFDLDVCSLLILYVEKLVNIWCSTLPNHFTSVYTEFAFDEAPVGFLMGESALVDAIPHSYPVTWL